jgi:pimeloyl-ACP methyl ester carboxylesterase
MRLEVMERGLVSNQPTLLFLHHFGGSGRTWEPVIRILKDQFHCLAVDLRGFGNSSAASSYTISDMADDVLEVIQQHQLNHLVLIGHSMGGKVAQAVAARGLDGLEGLVLVASSPPTPEPMEDNERERLLNAYGKRDAALETNRKIAKLPINPVDLEQLIEDNLRCAKTAWRAWLEVGSKEDTSNLVSSITCKTLIVAGGADGGLPAPILEREIKTRISGSSLEIIPGSGHLLPLEVPLALAGLIRAR